MNDKIEPDTYVITRANMGDRPAGGISTAALRKTATKEKERFPKEAEIILRSSYMDNIINSLGDKKDGGSYL